LARLGFLAEFKDGLVFGKFVFNRKISHLYSPNLANRLDVVRYLTVNLETIRIPMKNWLEYIDQKFADFEIYNLENNQESFYPNRNYRINGTYIFFEFDGVNKLKKIECGKYFLIENNPLNFTVSNAKVVFNKQMENYLEVIQHTYSGENNEKYELTFDIENTKLLDCFLKTPIEIGWVEQSYMYKDSCYKMILKILEKNHNLIMLDVGQQDLPFPGDKISNRIDTYILELTTSKKHREIQIETILPIQTSHNRL